MAPGREDEATPLLVSEAGQDGDTHQFYDLGAAEAEAGTLERSSRQTNLMRRASRRVSHRLSTFFGVGDEQPLQMRRVALAGHTDAPPRRPPSRAARPEAEYYHGELDAARAQRRLRAYGLHDGLFLIRSEPGSEDFVLSLAHDRRVSEFLISAGTAVAARYTIDDGPPFHDLDTLVAFYSERREGLPVTLGQPCSKRKPDEFDQLLTSSDVDEPRPPPTATTEGQVPRARTPYQAYSSNAHTSRLRRDKGQEPAYELVGMQQFSPWFLQLVTLVQVVLTGYAMFQGGIKPMRMSVKQDTVSVALGFDQVVYDLTIARPGNPFLGPDDGFLIRHGGAKFAPCMRNDISVQVARATQTEAEATLYGCCERRSGNESAFVTCGVTLEYDCPATWLGAGSVCASNCDDQRLAPCCLHNNGTCAIVTSSYCDALGGTYHPEAQRCGEVNCLRDSCGPGGSAENPDQGWRILTALFMHAGAIHLLVMLYVQLSVGVPLERKAGWLRIALIYLISGCGGNLVSALFVPNSAQVGASGAVYGLVATALVDLMHCWRLLKSPWVQLGTYLIQTAVLLLLGTTPWLDNFAHVGGFLFGLLGGIVFLPYVTFGAWDKFRKRLLLVICFPALVLAFLVVLVLFYRVQNTNFCPGCERIQCVDWVKGLCDNGAVSEA